MPQPSAHDLLPRALCVISTCDCVLFTPKFPKDPVAIHNLCGRAGCSHPLLSHLGQDGMNAHVLRDCGDYVRNPNSIEPVCYCSGSRREHSKYYSGAPKASLLPPTSFIAVSTPQPVDPAAGLSQSQAVLPPPPASIGLNPFLSTSTTFTKKKSNSKPRTEAQAYTETRRQNGIKRQREHKANKSPAPDHPALAGQLTAIPTSIPSQLSSRPSSLQLSTTSGLPTRLTFQVMLFPVNYGETPPEIGNSKVSKTAWKKLKLDNAFQLVPDAFGRLISVLEAKRLTFNITLNSESPDPLWRVLDSALLSHSKLANITFPTPDPVSPSTVTDYPTKVWSLARVYEALKTGKGQRGGFVTISRNLRPISPVQFTFDWVVQSALPNPNKASDTDPDLILAMVPSHPGVIRSNLEVFSIVDMSAPRKAKSYHGCFAFRVLALLPLTGICPEPTAVDPMIRLCDSATSTLCRLTSPSSDDSDTSNSRSRKKRRIKDMGDLLVLQPSDPHRGDSSRSWAQPATPQENDQATAVAPSTSHLPHPENTPTAAELMACTLEDEDDLILSQLTFSGALNALNQAHTVSAPTTTLLNFTSDIPATTAPASEERRDWPTRVYGDTHVNKVHQWLLNLSPGAGLFADAPPHPQVKISGNSVEDAALCLIAVLSFIDELKSNPTAKFTPPNGTTCARPPRNLAPFMNKYRQYWVNVQDEKALIASGWGVERSVILAALRIVTSKPALWGTASSRYCLPNVGSPHITQDHIRSLRVSGMLILLTLIHNHSAPLPVSPLLFQLLLESSFKDGPPATVLSAKNVVFSYDFLSKVDPANAELLKPWLELAPAANVRGHSPTSPLNVLLNSIAYQALALQDDLSSSMTIQSQQSWSATILSKGLFNMEPRYWTDNALQYIAEGFSMELYGTINIGSLLKKAEALDLTTSDITVTLYDRKIMDIHNDFIRHLDFRTEPPTSKGNSIDLVTADDMELVADGLRRAVARYMKAPGHPQELVGMLISPEDAERDLEKAFFRPQLLLQAVTDIPLLPTDPNWKIIFSLRAKPLNAKGKAKEASNLVFHTCTLAVDIPYTDEVAFMATPGKHESRLAFEKWFHGSLLHSITGYTQL